MKRFLEISYKALLSAAAVLPVVSCNKFLDEMPDNRTELDSSEKVSQVLISAYASVLPTCLQELMSDNVTDYGSEIDIYQTLYEQAYRFQDISGESFDTPYIIWDGTYKAIASANAALAAIEEMGGGEELDPQKGEALLCRAYGHFTLVNTFCQAYNTESSTTDLGIPYSTEPENSVFTEYDRGTVAEVYENIAKDIEAGYPLIDETMYAQPKWHFNKKAAAAFAAQFYLYYGDYGKAVQYATDALGEDPTPMFRNWDLYTGTSSEEYSNAYNSTEEAANLLNQGFNTLSGRYPTGRFVMTQGIAYNETILGDTPFGSMMSTNFPVTVLFQIANRSYIMPKMSEYFIYSNVTEGTGTPYVVQVMFTSEKTMIDRAEAYTMQKDYDRAAAELSYFYRSLGFTGSRTADQISSFYETALYNNPVLAPKGITLEAGTQTNLIKACIHARRIMTVHEGTRLLDLKRWGIAYSHAIDGEAPVEIKPYDLRLAIKLPNAVVAAGLEQNPR